MIKVLLSLVGPVHKGKPSCVTGSNHTPEVVGHANRAFLAVIPMALHLERWLGQEYQGSLMLQVCFICLIKNYQGTNGKSSSLP